MELEASARGRGEANNENRRAKHGSAGRTRTRLDLRPAWYPLSRDPYEWPCSGACKLRMKWGS